MTGFVPGLSALEAAIAVAADAALGRPPFRVLDLGGGPGVVAERMSARWPEAAVTMVDIDPVLLALARDGVPPAVSVLTADLGEPLPALLPAASNGWSADAGSAAAGSNGLDATGSWASGNGLAAGGRSEATHGSAASDGYDLITAVMTVHYLRPERIRALYRRCHQVMAPGGLLVVADLMPDDGLPSLMSALNPAPGEAAAELAWVQWWGEVGEAPEFARLMELRADVFRDRPPADFAGSVAWHGAAVRAAGFREAGLLWRDGRHAALAAVA
ncbi:hypothetical protein GCM10027087_22290 [Paractinoplanes abujensis]